MKNLTNTTPLYARFDIDLDYCTAEAAKKNLARYDYADLTVPNGIVWLAEDEILSVSQRLEAANRQIAVSEAAVADYQSRLELSRKATGSLRQAIEVAIGHLCDNGVEFDDEFDELFTKYDVADPRWEESEFAVTVTRSYSVKVLHRRGEEDEARDFAENLSEYGYDGNDWGGAEDEDNGLKVVSVYEADVEFEVSSY